MRLSVIAVSLALLFSQSALAQHSSGGGSGSGGSSSGSSGGGSHGGSSSGSGSSSGGHVSGGSPGSNASGSSGSTHGTSSQAAYGFVHAPGKIDPLHETATQPGGEPAFHSSVRGEPSEVHNELLDQALGKIQFSVRTNLKNEQPISGRSVRRIEIDPDRKAERKPALRKEELDRKHCHGHNCKLTTWTAGSTWRMSQDVYTTIQGDCAHLAAKLSQETKKVAALQASQDNACAMNPVGSECASATNTLNKLNVKIAQLHDRYDQCVLHDVRRKTNITVSPNGYIRALNCR